MSSGWDVIKPPPPQQPEEPEKAAWEVHQEPPRAPVGLRDQLRSELESAHSRFRDFLTVLTDYQWPQAAPEIARAVADLESWPGKASWLKATATRTTLSRVSAMNRFEAAHDRVLRVLEQTHDVLLDKKDFPGAAKTTLDHIDRVNRRLAGY